MNCQEITKEIINFSNTKSMVDSFFVDRKDISVEVIMDQKRKVIERLKYLKDTYFSLKAILWNLSGQENWIDLRKLIDLKENQERIKTNPEYFYELVRSIFCRYPVWHVDESLLQRIMDEILDFDQIINEKIDEFIETDPREERNNPVFISSTRLEIIDALKSGIINRLLRSKKKIKVRFGHSGLPPSYLALDMDGNELEFDKAANYFGKRMKSGKVKADYIGDQAALEMQGGEIQTKKIGDHAVYKMSGGRIYITESAKEKLGDNATGGAIFAEYVSGEFGNNSTKANFIIGDANKLPTNKKGGIVIIDRVGGKPEITDFSQYTAFINDDFTFGSVSEVNNYIKEVKGNLFGYNQITRDYVEYSRDTKIKKVSTEKELENWKKQEGGMCIINHQSKFNEPVTKGMTDGIMVIRKIPNGNIGVGMEGGVVILDNPVFTLEEARERVNYDRNGNGVILIRVRNEKDPNKTKLVEVK